MNIYLQTLYEDYSGSSMPDLTKKKITAFLDSYCKSLSPSEESFAYCDLSDMIFSYEEKGFSAGFYTAVELLTGRK